MKDKFDYGKFMSGLSQISDVPAAVKKHASTVSESKPSRPQTPARQKSQHQNRDYQPVQSTGLNSESVNDLVNMITRVNEGVEIEDQEETDEEISESESFIDRVGKIYLVLKPKDNDTLKDVVFESSISDMINLSEDVTESDIYGVYSDKSEAVKTAKNLLKA